MYPPQLVGSSSPRVRRVSLPTKSTRDPYLPLPNLYSSGTTSFFVSHLSRVLGSSHLSSTVPVPVTLSDLPFSPLRMSRTVLISYPTSRRLPLVPSDYLGRSLLYEPDSVTVTSTVLPRRVSTTSSTSPVTVTCLPHTFTPVLHDPTDTQRPLLKGRDLEVPSP